MNRVLASSDADSLENIKLLARIIGREALGLHDGCGVHIVHYARRAVARVPYDKESVLGFAHVSYSLS